MRANHGIRSALGAGLCVGGASLVLLVAVLVLHAVDHPTVAAAVDTTIEADDANHGGEHLAPTDGTRTPRKVVRLETADGEVHRQGPTRGRRVADAEQPDPGGPPRWTLPPHRGPPSA